MNIDDVRETLDAMLLNLRGKGYTNRGWDTPYELRADQDNIRLEVMVRSEDTPVEFKRTVQHAHEIPDAISALWTEIHNQPTELDFKRGKWRQKLVDLTAEGEELGFALEYVEMLRATAAKLASNALAGPKSSRRILYDDIVPGMKLLADDGFNCIAVDAVLEVKSDDNGGLFVECGSGSHYLDGQIGDDGYLVGFTIVD